MCEFCKNFSEHKKYGVPIRNGYTSDNFCEVLYDNDCEDCHGCTIKTFILQSASGKNRLGLVLFMKRPNVLWLKRVKWLQSTIARGVAKRFQSRQLLLKNIV